jgi:hypothetical protein
MKLMLEVVLHNHDIKATANFKTHGYDFKMIFTKVDNTIGKEQ